MPYVGHPINEVTLMVVSLGKTETRYTQRGVHMVAKKALAARKGGRLKETQTQMCVDLMLARVSRDKIDGKSNAQLLEVWQQLRAGQQFTSLKNQGKRGDEKASRPNA